MWKQGPLPKDTYNWGAVVKAGSDPTKGFHFADFRGNHVILEDGENTLLKPHQVGYYDNSIGTFTKADLERLVNKAVTV